MTTTHERYIVNIAVTITYILILFLHYETKDISQYINDVKLITTLKLDSIMEKNKISTRIINWEWN